MFDKSAWGKDRYYGLKEMGLCVNCGKDYAMIGRVLCPECSFKKSERERERYRNQTDEQRIKRNAQRLEIVHKRAEQGLCKCGKTIFDKRYKRCLECRLYFRRKQAERRQPKRYAELGLCLLCGGGGTVEGEKYCATHLEQMRQRCEQNFRPDGVVIADNDYFRRLNHADFERMKREENYAES